MIGFLRRSFKHIICWLAYYSSLLNVYVAFKRIFFKSPEFVILMYHQIWDPGVGRRGRHQPGMVTSKSTFLKQMRFLKERHDVVALNELVDSIGFRKRLSRFSVAVTFDDGWKDNYLHAFPVLRDLGLPATIFLTTDYIGTSKMLWFQMVSMICQRQPLTEKAMLSILEDVNGISSKEKTAIIMSLPDADKLVQVLKKIEPHAQAAIMERMIESSNASPDVMDGGKWMLDWREAREMSSQGISFGSHGTSHRILTLLSSDENDRELIESKKAIEREIGIPVTSFAYPNGDFNSGVESAVKRAGYHYACAACPAGLGQNPTDPFALPRLGIHEGMCAGIMGRFSRAIFACQIAGFFGRSKRMAGSPFSEEAVTSNSGFQGCA